VQPSPLKQLSPSGTAIGTLRISVGRKQEETTKPRKKHCCCGAEKSKGNAGDAAAAVVHAIKGGNEEDKKGVFAAAALPHAVAPVGAPSMYSCGGAEEKKGCDGDAAATFAHAVTPVGAQSVTVAGPYGEWRGYNKSCCCTEQRWFRKDQVTRRDSVARRSKFDNWRLAAEQGFTRTIARAEIQDQVSEHERALEFHPNKPPNYREEV
jgi:hypothetical protein